MRFKYIGRFLRRVLLIFFASLFSLQSPFAFAEENYLKHPNRTEWQAGGFYEGTLGDGTSFQMNLPYPPPNSIDRTNWGPSAVSASYWYPRRFSGKTIALKIKSFDDKSFLITAQNFDSNGKSIDEEIFEGVFSPDKTRAQGVWTFIKKKKKLSFAMKRVFAYKGVDVSFRSEEGKEYDPEHPFVFSTTFPVVGDQKVDGWIKDLISDCDHDLECNNSVEVVWFSKEMFSLHGSVWGYSHGMAHGNGYSKYRHYVTAGVTPNAVMLDHFISISDSCSGSISHKIIAALKKQKYSHAEAAELGDGEHVKFLPTPSGILFTFDPYEVGTYAEGAPSVFIERQKLGKCIKYLPKHE